ncbi:hypothetical protein SAY86_006726 [Trapa natans]|uniref:Uncharacterized protein n=1 Tax=Trapa natans TaxID=22666 RepID=A0AAN7LAB3_TRANT|nr:hypothetical protein SAY86_006726 [Trapa natans]
MVEWVELLIYGSHRTIPPEEKKLRKGDRVVACIYQELHLLNLVYPLFGLKGALRFALPLMTCYSLPLLFLFVFLTLCACSSSTAYIISENFLIAYLCSRIDALRMWLSHGSEQ